MELRSLFVLFALLSVALCANLKRKKRGAGAFEEPVPVKEAGAHRAHEDSWLFNLMNTLTSTPEAGEDGTLKPEEKAETTKANEEQTSETVTPAAPEGEGSGEGDKETERNPRDLNAQQSRGIPNRGSQRRPPYPIYTPDYQSPFPAFQEDPRYFRYSEQRGYDWRDPSQFNALRNDFSHFYHPSPPPFEQPGQYRGYQQPQQFQGRYQGPQQTQFQGQQEAQFLGQQQGQFQEQQSGQFQGQQPGQFQGLQPGQFQEQQPSQFQQQQPGQFQGQQEPVYPQIPEPSPLTYGIPNRRF